MKSIIAAATTLALALTLPLLAAPVLAKTEQQNKMTTCNKDAGAKGLKGDERKAFMKSCLSADAAPAAAPAKKPTIGECASKTKGMSKDEASKFKSDCMKGGA